MDARKLSELLGVDLIPYAFGLTEFDENKSNKPFTYKDIKEQIQGLGDKKLDDALNYSKELLNEESARGEKIESKAFSLIGVTGISTAFVTGISSLLPKANLTTFLLILLALSYVFVVISLTLTILLAFKVVVVGKYKYFTPDIFDVYKMESISLLETKKDRLTTYLSCYDNNSKIHNIKASYLIGAQLWFRNSVLSFLFLAFILIPVFFHNTSDTNTLPTPTQTILLPIDLQETQNIGKPSIQPTLAKMASETPTMHSSIEIPSTKTSIFYTATP